MISALRSPGRQSQPSALCLFQLWHAEWELQVRAFHKAPIFTLPGIPGHSPVLGSSGIATACFPVSVFWRMWCFRNGLVYLHALLKGGNLMSSAPANRTKVCGCVAVFCRENLAITVGAGSYWTDRHKKVPNVPDVYVWNCRITEYPKLEGTHKDHQLQLQAPSVQECYPDASGTPALKAMPTALGSRLHARPPSGADPVPNP